LSSFQKKYNVDERSVIEAAKLNPDRFAPLYNFYYKAIFSYVFQKIRDEETTADITARIFLKALLNIKQYKHMGFPFSSWLYKIAGNEVNMHFRKQNKIQEVEITEREIFHLVNDLEDVNPSTCSVEEVIEALNQLPLEQMELIDLRFFEKMSFKEIGDLVGITEGNAKIKVYRALDKLKKILTGT
jgi:RNA polymerase sigma-70 factor (ECF subfamily)